MIIEDSPGLLVTFDAKDGWVRFEFKGFIEGEAYRRPLDAAIKAMIAHKVNKVLWDCRRMKVLTPEDQAWAESDWTPRLVKEAKAKRSAVVVPKSVLAQMSVKRVADKSAPHTRNELDSRHFDSIEAAEKWLRSGD
ncbi:MAG: STAS/SEC14 domain-containing protein [Polyangiaceae bacterium]|nr:STAS/SEC14 domain-containing protein [Polyangiaceae bacterium]